MHYARHGRDLPWRHTQDPYRILVSEVMLQQTQVKRVLAFFTEFIKHFPTAKSLARAPLSKVLRQWQGLGYNRRAKFLQQAAQYITTHSWPKNLEDLPGVGRYTARAVTTFVYDKPEVFVETNIRTVFLYHCYSSVLQKTAISDAQLLPLVAGALTQSKMPPREFYWMLMDYGSFLKKQGIKLNSRSKHYTKQSKFKGSRRQKRAARLRKLLARGASDKELEEILHS